MQGFDQIHVSLNIREMKMRTSKGLLPCRLHIAYYVDSIKNSDKSSLFFTYHITHNICRSYLQERPTLFTLCRSDPLSAASYLTRHSRPEPNNNIPQLEKVKHRTFPEQVDRIPLVKADCSIPPLHDVPTPEVG